MSASNKLPSYGAVASADDEEKAVDQSFDAANTYYLRETTRWSTKKCLLIAVPILGAILIVGGFALFLLRDFSHLYPGRGGDKSGYYAHGGEHVVPSSSKTTSGVNAPMTPSSKTDDDETGDESSESKTTTTTKHDKSKSVAPNKDAGATCAVHPDCAGLIGNCCPTDKGVVLECCAN